MNGASSQRLTILLRHRWPNVQRCYRQTMVGCDEMFAEMGGFGVQSFANIAALAMKSKISDGFAKLAAKLCESSTPALHSASRARLQAAVELRAVNARCQAKAIKRLQVG